MTALALRHDQDWAGFAVVLGLLALVLLWTWWDLRKPRRLYRAAVARCEQLLAEPWPDLTPRLAAVPDPESLDGTRPADADVCTICDGEGAVRYPVGDPYDPEFESVECWSCRGTGIRGAV